jgi:HPt (histidine-containing phosphotransfer) domain-containing protein
MSDDFLRAWRRVTLALGYRTVGKAVASLAAKGKVATAKHAAHTLTEADQEYITALESQLVEAETFFQEFPMLTNPPIRTVHRFHARKGIYAKGASWGPTEQITVNEELARRLKGRGRAVEYNKRTGQWWADVEDEAWGRDVNLEELFGARAGSAGYEFDDVLPMYRRAVAFKANIPYIQAEIARVQVEGA